MQMKKYLFFALAAAGMLSSCSSDDVVSNGTNANDDNSPVPIRIGIGQAFTTRGTGTVGGVGDGSNVANVWAGQYINVFMFNKITNQNRKQPIAIFKHAVSMISHDTAIFPEPLP